MKTPISSIGYEGLSIEQFISILKEEKITRIVDVREHAFSYKKGFSKTPLMNVLSADGIQYVHFREIAPPRELRKHYETLGDFPGFCMAYKEFLESIPDKMEHFLTSLQPGDCLLCFEKDLEKCHRSVLKSFIKAHVNDLRIGT